VKRTEKSSKNPFFSTNPNSNQKEKIGRKNSQNKAILFFNTKNNGNNIGGVQHQLDVGGAQHQFHRIGGAPGLSCHIHPHHTMTFSMTMNKYPHRVPCSLGTGLGLDNHLAANHYSLPPCRNVSCPKYAQ